MSRLFHKMQDLLKFRKAGVNTCKRAALLCAICEAPGLTSPELGASQRDEPRDILLTARALEKLGLVYMENTKDENDRPRLSFFPTPSGMSLVGGPIGNTGEIPSGKDIMVDLETLGRKPGCVVHEIAAVEFDITTMKPGRSFRVSIDIEDAERNGLTIDDETWEWWEEKGGVVLDDPQSFADGFNQFAAWLNEIGPVRFWSCGTCFERPILEHCFGLLDLDLPYHYGAGRDFRTVWDLAFPGVKREKVAHRALADCYEQIKQLGQALEVCPMGGGVR